MATIIADLNAGKRAQKQAGLELAAQGLNQLGRVMFQHHIAVQREKALETDSLLAAADKFGVESIGEKGLEKLEANLGTQFPRNEAGKITIPDSPISNASESSGSKSVVAISSP